MIKLNDLTKKYINGSNEFKALKNINLEINDNEFVAIVGKSGSGKTTLLNIIGTLDNFTSGSLTIDDVDIASLNNNKISAFRNEKVGFVFQNFYLEPEYTVYENIELPLIIAGSFGKQNEDKINDIAKQVDINSKLKNKVKTLSGGECQRVAIARAIVNSPEIILADEPCGNLDLENSAKVMKILKNLHKQGKTVILVTHDLEDAKLADRIITLSDGEIVLDEKISER